MPPRNPNAARQHANAGLVAEEAGHLAAAIEHYQQALQCDSALPEAWINLGSIYHRLQRLDEAEACYQKASALTPSAELLNNLSVLSLQRREITEAVRYAEEAVALAPMMADAHLNLANAYKQQGALSAAESALRQVLAIEPEHAAGHWNLSLLLLLQRRWQAGWALYPWGEKAGVRPASFLPQKQRWRGEPNPTATLLLQTEQGIGDTIFFANYWPRLQQRVGALWVACDPRLIPLLARSFPDVQFFSAQRFPSALTTEQLEQIDLVCSESSLPHLIEPDPERLAPQPILRPDPERTAHWRSRMEALGEGMKIGISWRGGTEAAIRLQRTIPLALWQPLLSAPALADRCHWINLQYGESTADIHRMAAIGITIENWPDADPLRDLDDFAAQIVALDQVISVDNSTVHFAGALGVPVWTLLPMVPDGRWGITGEETAWYRSMRLYRQRERNKWSDLMQRVESDMSHKIQRPIFVVGLPRSGTSLITGLLAQCGAWVGETLAGNSYNSLGYFEHIRLKEDVLKQMLIALHADPLGVRELPDLNRTKNLDPTLYRKKIREILDEEGYKNDMPWLFKDPKLSLIWPIWNKIYPDAVWVIVDRERDEIIDSYLRTPFMAQYGYNRSRWNKWCDDYEKRLQLLELDVSNCYRINVESVINNRLESLHFLVSKVGLNWNEKSVKSFIKPELLHHKNRIHSNAGDSVVKENKNNLSRKGAQLLEMYRIMAQDGYHRNDGYHIENAFSDFESRFFREPILEALKKYHINTLLDYGSGGSDWYQAGFDPVSEKSAVEYFDLQSVYRYEPSRQIDERQQVEAVICFDVLEHLFICDVPLLLNEIFSYASRLVIINVACYPAAAQLPNGENAHTTVRPPIWWKGMIDSIAINYPDIAVLLFCSTAWRDASMFPIWQTGQWLSDENFSIES